MNKQCIRLLLFFLVFVMVMGCKTAPEKKELPKVLVVMSYSEDSPWVQDIKAGVDSVLEGMAELVYFYMDTNKDIDQGPAKAKEAYELSKKIDAKGIIVADDNGQSMFVVEYIKDKEDVPVMFCGVNAEPDAYGYPASNVSGILERMSVSESINLMKKLVPSANKIAYMMMKSPTADAMLGQIESEKSGYNMQSVEYKLPTSKAEAIAMAEELQSKCDVLFLTKVEGLKDDAGNPMAEDEIMLAISKAFGKPVIGTTAPHVECGAALLAVTKTGFEQGSVAAEMLLKALKGRPVKDIPITQNKGGKKYVNITVMKALGISAENNVLADVETVE